MGSTLCLSWAWSRSGQQCWAGFLHWPRPGKGRTFANCREAARSGEGARGTRKDTISTTNRGPMSTLFTQINNFLQTQETARVAEGPPWDAGAQRCVFPLAQTAESPEAANSFWSPEACFSESVSKDLQGGQSGGPSFTLQGFSFPTFLKSGHLFRGSAGPILSWRRAS